MCGYLKGVVDSNEKLIKLFTRALHIISVIALVAVGAVIYGAIGENGMKSVRNLMPDLTYAIPTHNDLDQWQHKHHV